MKRTLKQIDWTAEASDLRGALYSMLRRRGFRSHELQDRTQEAFALLLIRARNRASEPVNCAIYRAVQDAARGRRAANTSPGAGYIDACDYQSRSRIDRERAEDFSRRAQLALLDLDI